MWRNGEKWKNNELAREDIREVSEPLEKGNKASQKRITSRNLDYMARTGRRYLVKVPKSALLQLARAFPRLQKGSHLVVF